MKLPNDFIEYTRQLMGDELYATLTSAFNDEAPVSIRLNPFKTSAEAHVAGGERVPWARDGWYLPSRPTFTFDPLLHAGAYYVEEASSMFIDFVVRQMVKHPVAMLDLCAAPGGKSICARAALPEGSILFSNEPIRMRANILAENLLKMGHTDVVVTNNYPRDYGKTKMMFDVVLTDVPCSGEGMFRKDEQAISDWSKEKVASCAKLQKSIVSDIWPRLKPGGVLIYSTCTFNAFEDEDNVDWICRELGGTTIALDGIQPEWGITGALCGDVNCYRFIPGRTRGEGLFVAVIRKDGDYEPPRDTPSEHDYTKDMRKLSVMAHGIAEPTKKGKKTIPDISLALSTNKEANHYPTAIVDWATAVSYLRHEAIVLPDDTPRGIVTIAFKGHSLGFANNLGNRANNLYPQEWRIKSSHLPNTEVSIIEE